MLVVNGLREGIVSDIHDLSNHKKLKQLKIGDEVHIYLRGKLGAGEHCKGLWQTA